MKRQFTEEANDCLAPDFVIDFLATMMHTEISNPIQRDGDVLWVTLSDQTTARITAPKVDRSTIPPEQSEATVHNIATLRYVMQHDYGYGDENVNHKINQLELHNLDECRTYLEDAIGSQLNAYFTNYLIEFMNGEKYLLSIELKQKQ